MVRGPWFCRYERDEGLAGVTVPVALALVCRGAPAPQVSRTPSAQEVQPPCRPSIITRSVAVLGLFLRCSGWLRWSGRIPLLLSPSLHVTSPFSAGWMSRAVHGFYWRVEYCDSGLIKELDVHLRVFVVFMGYGNLLSPVFLYFLCHVFTAVVFLCSFLRKSDVQW